MIRITKRFLFMLIFCCCSKTLFAQNKQIDSLLSILKTAKEDTGKVNLLNMLSQHLWRAAEYSRAIEYAADALSLGEKLRFNPGIANAYYNIGVTYWYRGNYTEALKAQLASLQIREVIGDKKGIANVYNNIGNINNSQGNYPESLKYHFASLKIREEIGDKGPIADSYNNIGEVYRMQFQYPEALNNQLIALKIREEIGDKRSIAYSYNNIGIIYWSQGNYSEAMKYHLACLKIREEIGDKQTLAVPYINIGLTYDRQGHYSEALNNYFAGLKIAEEIGDKNMIANVYNDIGELYTKLKRFPEARQYLNDDLSLYKELGSKEGIKDCYDGLAQLDSATGNWKGAYQNHKLFIVYDDSLRNEENTKKSVRFQMQFEFDKKEDSLKYQQSLADEKLKLQLQSQKKQKIFYIGGFALSVLVFALIFYNLKVRQRANATIAAERLKTENATTAHKMAELELQSLRTQLNPHFMFNSLNSIQELILLEENEKSQAYLARFGKLLRMLLENAESPFISLRKEIDFLQLYLGLDNLRIPNLQYSISTDPTLNTEETLIPNMILQPYIENAIWHGLSPKETDKQLQIRIYRENGTVNYEIEDNGVGRTKAAELKSLFRKKHKSKGMELLTKRFKLLNEEYGSDIKTTVTDVIKNNEVAGTLVKVKVPVKLTEHLLN